jgi:hypothetical protein
LREPGDSNGWPKNPIIDLKNRRTFTLFTIKRPMVDLLNMQSKFPVLATWTIRSENELFKEQITTAPLLLADDFDTRVQSERSNTFIMFRQQSSCQRSNVYFEVRAQLPQELGNFGLPMVTP